MNKTATIIGATGLIGSRILELLEKDEQFGEIRVISRRHVALDHPKVKVIVIDFADKELYKSAIEDSDAVFVAVGTTNKKVKGDKEKYRKIDYDIPVNAARFCEETGCWRFMLVSAVGANSNSSNFYTSLKGEVEDTITKMNIPTIGIFRPSMLLGDRDEFRLGEEIGKVIMKPLSFLIPAKYRPIQARVVAGAMVKASKDQKEGVKIYHYREMKG